MRAKTDKDPEQLVGIARAASYLGFYDTAQALLQSAADAAYEGSEHQPQAATSAWWSRYYQTADAIVQVMQALPRGSIMMELEQTTQQTLRKLGFWVEVPQGLAAGAPSLLLVAPCYGWLWVLPEGQSLPPAAERWQRRARRVGVRAAVVHSAQQARNVAISWRACPNRELELTDE